MSDKADETDAFERDLGNIETAARAVEIYENDVKLLEALKLFVLEIMIKNIYYWIRFYGLAGP